MVGWKRVMARFRLSPILCTVALTSVAARAQNRLYSAESMIAMRQLKTILPRDVLVGWNYEVGYPCLVLMTPDAAGSRSIGAENLSISAYLGASAIYNGSAGSAFGKLEVYAEGDQRTPPPAVAAQWSKDGRLLRIETAQNTVDARSFLIRNGHIYRLDPGYGARYVMRRCSVEIVRRSSQSAAEGPIDSVVMRGCGDRLEDPNQTFACQGLLPQPEYERRVAAEMMRRQQVAQIEALRAQAQPLIAPPAVHVTQSVEARLVSPPPVVAPSLGVAAPAARKLGEALYSDPRYTKVVQTIEDEKIRAEARRKVAAAKVKPRAVVVRKAPGENESEEPYVRTSVEARLVSPAESSEDIIEPTPKAPSLLDNAH